MTTTTPAHSTFPPPPTPRGLRALLVAWGGLWTRPYAALFGVPYPLRDALARVLRELRTLHRDARHSARFAREELEAAEAARVRIEDLQADYGRARVAALVLDIEAALDRSENKFQNNC